MPRFRYDPSDGDDLTADAADDLFGDQLGDSDRPPRSRRRPKTRREDEAFVDHRLPPDTSLSSYPDAVHGPSPSPTWVVTSGDAYDLECGRVKTGKEADVDLVERVERSTGRTNLLAAKRYRTAEHRMFHRDAGYLEGRRVRRSREMRAMGNRTAFGRSLLGEQWAATEFDVLGRLWSAGVPVPYPVQLIGSELLLEFCGTPDGEAAPRLAEIDADTTDLGDLWSQCVDALEAMVSLGYAHGDLSEYNLLVHDGRLIVIDLPQVVDVVGNPQGWEYLARDCRNVCRWFAARGVAADADELLARLAPIGQG